MPFLDATTGSYPEPHVSLRSTTDFTLLTPFEYQDGATTTTVPAPWPTDFASIPTWLWGILAPYGKQTLPAILHDYLCDRVPTYPAAERWTKRKAADDLFRRALRDQANAPEGDRSVSRTRATLFWAGVTVGRYWAYRKVRLVLIAVVALVLSIGLYAAPFLLASRLHGWALLWTIPVALVPSLILGFCASIEFNTVGLLLVVAAVTALPVAVLLALNLAAILVLNVLPWVVPYILYRLHCGPPVGAPPEVKPTLGPLG